MLLNIEYQVQFLISAFYLLRTQIKNILDKYRAYLGIFYLIVTIYLKLVNSKYALIASFIYRKVATNDFITS